MRPIPLVKACWARPFVEFFRGIGTPLDAWLSRSGIVAEVLEGDELACPARPLLGSLDELVQLASDTGGCEIGLKVGLRTGLASLGSFGQAVTSASTLGEAIETAQRRIASVHSARTFELGCSG